ncbi:MAG TPA: protein phosphatase 2C domain-containing protein [Gemmatimonadales bacterium]
MTAAGGTVQVESFGLTDIGKIREINEDQFVIASLRKSVRVRHTSLSDTGLVARLAGLESYLFVIADGVGGRPGGELASTSAVSSLLEYVDQAVVAYHSLDVDQEHDFLARLEGAVQRAHQRILEEYGTSGKGPATTLTMVTLTWPRAYLVHVGDSRAYFLRGGRLRQITRDQTTGEYMVDVGAWTEEQAARAKLGANLTSALGGSEMTPVVGLIDLEPGDVLLLCTDGLTKHVTDPQIAAVLGGRGSAEAMCRELVQQTLEAGGTDNVTVIVAKLGG